jgi:hypothetical protein
MSVDDQLLNQQGGRAGSAAKVAALNEARRGGADGDNQGSDEVSSWLALRGLIRKQREAQAGGAGSAVVSAATAPARQITNNWLQQAWLNLIDSWGLTLVWINIHVWLGVILGHQFFGKLGSEWMDNLPGEGPGKMLETIEPMTLALLDLLVLLIILTIVALIAMIVGFINNPLSAIWNILETIAGNLWSQWGFK